MDLTRQLIREPIGASYPPWEARLTMRAAAEVPEVLPTPTKSNTC